MRRNPRLQTSHHSPCATFRFFGIHTYEVHHGGLFYVSCHILINDCTGAAGQYRDLVALNSLNLRQYRDLVALNPLKLRQYPFNLSL